MKNHNEADEESELFPLRNGSDGSEWYAKWYPNQYLPVLS